MDDTPVVVTIPPKLTVDERSYAFRSNGEVKTVTWAAGDVAKTEAMLGGVYEARKTLQFLPDILLAPQRPADVAVALATRVALRDRAGTGRVLPRARRLGRRGTVVPRPRRSTST